MCSQILLAACLKGIGKWSSLLARCGSAYESALESRPVLKAFVLAFLADSLTMLNLQEEADRILGSAATLLLRHDGAAAAAWLNLVAGERFRLQSNLEGALGAYRSGRLSYESLGMTAWAAFARVVAAEVLLGMGRASES